MRSGHIMGQCCTVSSQRGTEDGVCLQCPAVGTPSGTDRQRCWEPWKVDGERLFYAEVVGVPRGEREAQTGKVGPWRAAGIVSPRRKP